MSNASLCCLLGGCGKHKKQDLFVLRSFFKPNCYYQALIHINKLWFKQFCDVRTFFFIHKLWNKNTLNFLNSNSSILFVYQCSLSILSLEWLVSYYVCQMAVLRAEFNVNSFQLKFLVDLFRGGPTQGIALSVSIIVCVIQWKS